MLVISGNVPVGAGFVLVVLCRGGGVMSWMYILCPIKNMVPVSCR